MIDTGSVQRTDIEPPRTAATTRLIRPLRSHRGIGPDALAHAVHGLVLFVAITGATFVADYPAWKMLLYAAGGVVLFWSAHVYSAVLGHHHIADVPARAGVALAVREARRSLPLLEACIAPAIPLVLAAFGLIAAPFAYAASLTVGLVALALVAFLSLRGRHASWRRSLAAATVAGGIGAAIIAAETFLH